MNKRIIIVGGGASVRQDQWDSPVKDLLLWKFLDEESTISLNYTFRYFTPTIACFHDESFYRSNLEELKNLPLIVGKYARNVEDVQLSNTLLVKGLFEYRENQWKEGFYASNLVGVLALSMAINLGYTEIFLLGFDFGTTDSKYTHFYQDEVDLTEQDCNNSLKYRGMGKTIVNGKERYCTSNYENPASKYFAEFERFKKTHTIINVGLESKIDQFPKIDYDEFLDYLYKYSNNVNQATERESIESVFSSKGSI